MARKTEKGGKFRNVHCRTSNMNQSRHPLRWVLRGWEFARRANPPTRVGPSVSRSSDVWAVVGVARAPRVA